ncbi:MAG: hypothetical protein AW10_04259 [Candidatus Accumulibacter appositus]|uniref:Uncharacterized protein n=1 Tax=Candidatus Accumulibacter appositus TaxID=1454003 RepID=A0A011NBQ6_9PROT|nr:MAG: hypothetical protein AW10_04259 [Candidatus Accumulibacter appositus]
MDFFEVPIFNPEMVRDVGVERCSGYAPSAKLGFDFRATVDVTLCANERREAKQAGAAGRDPGKPFFVSARRVVLLVIGVQEMSVAPRLFEKIFESAVSVKKDNARYFTQVAVAGGKTKRIANGSAELGGDLR